MRVGAAGWHASAVARRPVRRFLLLGHGAVLTMAACATAPVSVGSEAGGPAVAATAEGRTVFLELSEPRCATCHTLADAGASGTLGPDLDELRPDVGRVIRAVTQGVGIMGPQEHLTELEVEALAAYVAATTGGASP